MDIEIYMQEKLETVKKASRKMRVIDTVVKNVALMKMANELIKNKEYIKDNNNIDIEKARQNNMSEAMIDRLLLDDKRIESMAEGLTQLAKAEDPVGETIRMWKTENGLNIGQVRVPIGVIGIIYESRPNVTADAIGLCLKSGNAVILRGGSDAINSNIAIANVLKKAAYSEGIPKGSIEFVEISDREATTHMMRANGYVDVLIPRGGKGLIDAVVKNSTVPVIETGTGNCHIYVDEYADFEMAENIIINAKTQRPSVCNAVETVLIHSNIADAFMKRLGYMLGSYGVEMRGCKKARACYKDVREATEKDWSEEYLDMKVAIKIVDSIDEAINHIAEYSTGHSEAIITENYTKARKFLRDVDAAAVYVNASTRFTDGSQFGFGAEMGISTQKLHTRGPMGLKELTTIKNVIYGEGQVRI